jgi:hypothetical protein
LHHFTIPYYSYLQIYFQLQLNCYQWYLVWSEEIIWKKHLHLWTRILKNKWLIINIETKMNQFIVWTLHVRFLIHLLKTWCQWELKKINFRFWEINLKVQSLQETMTLQILNSNHTMPILWWIPNHISKMILMILIAAMIAI